MSMTWGEFVQAVEGLGVQADTVVLGIRLGEGNRSQIRIQHGLNGIIIVTHGQIWSPTTPEPETGEGLEPR